MKRTRISSTAFAVVLAGTLAACQQASAPGTQGESAATSAPDAKPGLSLSDGQLMLPVVSGRPGAVYFKVHNSGDKPASIVSAHVEGAAKAEMHETKGGTMTAVDQVDIGPNDTVEFGRGGLHVMAFELPAEFAPGGTTELTLTFSDGDKISAPLAIQSMTGDGMAGMDHEAKN